MAILDLRSGKTITGVLSRGERARTYRLLCDRLDDADLTAIRTTLDERIAGSRIETSAWIPGNDWSGTVYDPIYQKAAAKNEELAGLMFGLLVWEAFERHPDDWYTERFSMGGEEDRFRVYFKPG